MYFVVFVSNAVMWFSDVNLLCTSGYPAFYSYKCRFDSLFSKGDQTAISGTKRNPLQPARENGQIWRATLMNKIIIFNAR